MTHEMQQMISLVKTHISSGSNIYLLEELDHICSDIARKCDLLRNLPPCIFLKRGNIVKGANTNTVVAVTGGKHRVPSVIDGCTDDVFYDDVKDIMYQDRAAQLADGLLMVAEYPKKRFMTNSQVSYVLQYKLPINDLQLGIALNVTNIISVKKICN